ncbi:MAG: DNA methyltransferase, partial [Pseudomonadota bacterium]
MDYLDKINIIYRSGKATEHSYRPALKEYVETLLSGITATNEPKRQKCGAPDYIITRHTRGNDIDIGYIEAKDIGVDLDKTEKDEQLTRYKESLDNLILTDYIDFRFFKDGKKVAEVKIARAEQGKIITLPENINTLEALLKDFAAFQGQTINSAKTLAVMMARKAKMMQEVFYKAVENEQEHTGLKSQLDAFRKILIHDMTAEDFSDVYAQTITYGLFTARLHSEKSESFSRKEALDLIPLSNPFLRKLFQYVALELDEGVKWIVDAVCELLRVTDMHDIMQDFGKQSGRNDPIVHFYETFLAEYSFNLRKSRGVWYTPEPVVSFIIRAIDECLKIHFNLPMGLADTSKVKIKVDATQLSDNRTKSGKALIEKEVHKVQLLDVTTGTGTFISEVIKQIYNGYFQNQQGMWSGYVEEHLLPRLHGFEILMASYAMCHLKIDLLLQETGYKPKNDKRSPRLGVYLTNSLEEAHPEAETLFASWLSSEANEASLIKKETPVMVAMGNPPYNVSTQNKNEWIDNLISDYKKGLNEKNINPLSDDYIKFIRHAEHYIEKTGYGIIAMITNNSFLDGIIHRQMRKHLLETFDTIYI